MTKGYKHYSTTEYYSTTEFWKPSNT